MRQRHGLWTVKPSCRAFSVQLSRFFAAFCGYYTPHFAFMFVTGDTHFYIVFKIPSFESNRLSRRSSTMCLDGFYRYHCWSCQQWLGVTWLINKGQQLVIVVKNWIIDCCIVLVALVATKLKTLYYVFVFSFDTLHFSC